MTPAKTPSRPNVVWLNADHYAFAHHFRLYRDAIRTPTYDRLCADGVRFDNAYTICPLCTPARASLVTGQLPHRHGILNNDGARLNSRDSFRPDAPLYSHALRAAGVRPALFGKWHAVGGGPGTAQDHGFEGWTLPGYGDPYGSDRYREYLRERGLPEEPMVDVEWHIRDAARVGRVRLADTGGRAAGVAYHPSAGVIADAPKEVHEAYFVAHLANRYLEERARDGEPFCLRVDPWGPHQPYFVAAPFAGTVDPASLPEYPSFSHDLADRPEHHRDFARRIRDGSATVTWDDWRPVLARCFEHLALVDDALGTVLATLDRLGLAENTVVIHSADHGDILAAHGGVFDKGWLLVEETLRIPVAARWPGVGAPGGATCDALVSNLDIVATLRDLAGAAPADAPQDGTSLAPLLRDPSPAAATSWPDDLVVESHGHYGQWVFQRALRFGTWKYVAHLDDRDELYDLSDDPFELRNRIDDLAAAPALAEARRRLAARMERSNDDAPDALRLRERL